MAFDPEDLFELDEPQSVEPPASRRRRSPDEDDAPPRRRAGAKAQANPLKKIGGGALLAFGIFLVVVVVATQREKLIDDTRAIACLGLGITCIGLSSPLLGVSVHSPFGQGAAFIATIGILVMTGGRLLIVAAKRLGLDPKVVANAPPGNPAPAPNAKPAPPAGAGGGWAGLLDAMGGGAKKKAAAENAPELVNPEGNENLNLVQLTRSSFYPGGLSGSPRLQVDFKVTGKIELGDQLAIITQFGDKLYECPLAIFIEPEGTSDVNFMGLALAGSQAPRCWVEYRNFMRGLEPKRASNVITAVPNSKGNPFIINIGVPGGGGIAQPYDRERAMGLGALPKNGEGAPNPAPGQPRGPELAGADRGPPREPPLGKKPRDQQSIDELLAALEDAKPFEAGFILREIGERRPNEKKEEVARVLVEHLSSPDQQSRNAAAGALVSWATPESVPALIKALNDKSPWVRDDSIKALARLRDPRAIEPLTQLFPKERSKIHDALVEFGAQAESSVIELLQYPDWPVQTDAAKLLGIIGTRKCLPALRDAAAGDRGLVAMAAKEAINTIRFREKMGPEPQEGRRPPGRPVRPGKSKRPVNDGLLEPVEG